MKDVHTEHCCSIHGCKYGDEDCSVTTGYKKQSSSCELCSDDAEQNNLYSVLSLLGKRFKELFPHIHFMDNSDYPDTMLDVHLVLEFMTNRIKEAENVMFGDGDIEEYKNKYGK